MKIAVIEDEKKQSELLCEYLLRFQKENPGFSMEEEPSCFSSGEAFLASEEIYDLVFFDIQLNEKLNGMETAKKFRLKNKDTSIIFVTNLGQYAIDGYEVEALSYCLKPLSYADFNMKMKKFMSRYSTKASMKIAIDEVDGSKVVIESKDIQYIEIIKHYLSYHTIQNQKEGYKTRGKIAQAYQQLEGLSNFYMINSGVIVNMQHITKIDDNVVCVGSAELPISRSRKKAFMIAFTKYTAGGGSQQLNEYSGISNLRRTKIRYRSIGRRTFTVSSCPCEKKKLFLSKTYHFQSSLFC